MTTFFTITQSPLGPLILAGDGCALTAIQMSASGGEPLPDPLWARDDRAAPFDEAVDQLRAYFAGRRALFDLPLSPYGTEFQRLVWAELCKIPFGQTIGYAELARRIGRPNASRAVGSANSRNPIAIVVPCHRTIGSSGNLVGYAGGLRNKQALLEHERRFAPKGRCQIEIGFPSG